MSPTDQCACKRSRTPLNPVPKSLCCLAYSADASRYRLPSEAIVVVDSDEEVPALLAQDFDDCEIGLMSESGPACRSIAYRLEECTQEEGAMNC
jgi:hypothetical protein